jgi:hypothetical protein
MEESIAGAVMVRQLQRLNNKHHQDIRQMLYIGLDAVSGQIVPARASS